MLASNNQQYTAEFNAHLVSNNVTPVSQLPARPKMFTTEYDILAQELKKLRDVASNQFIRATVLADSVNTTTKDNFSKQSTIDSMLRQHQHMMSNIDNLEKELTKRHNEVADFKCTLSDLKDQVAQLQKNLSDKDDKIKDMQYQLDHHKKSDKYIVSSVDEDYKTLANNCVRGLSMVIKGFCNFITSVFLILCRPLILLFNWFKSYMSK